MRRSLRRQRGASFGLVLIVVCTVPQDSFSFERTKTGWDLTVSYDVQKHIVANVDVVMHLVHTESYVKK